MAKTPMALSEAVTDQELDAVMKRLHINSAELDRMVESVVNSYCDKIDGIVIKIQDILENHKTLSDTQLEYYIMRIPGDLYFANTAGEYLSIRDDISKMLYKEKFNTSRQKVQGTVSDKDASAELLCKSEALVSIIYTRSTRMVKAKLDMAYELLNALKKILTFRISAVDLERSANLIAKKG